MPGSDIELQVLVLNASLKHAPELSNTEEVANVVLEEMKKHGNIRSATVRLSDMNIPAGLSYRMNDDDEWPKVVAQIVAADIILFATPIWWGNRSSLMQRIIERMDAFDEGEIEGGRGALLNKVAGIVITGSEDGAQHALASIMEVLTFMNFTLPPQCCTYWVGEVGMDPKTDRDRRLKNEAVTKMAMNMGRNLMYYGQLLKKYPLVEEKTAS